MKANSSPMSVVDYCQAMLANKIRVNADYQRKDGLWNIPAKTFFIESILLEYPIPKLFLYSKLDLKSRETVKEIVDGQQRSQALVDFFENKLKLSSKLDTEELRGLKYSSLPDEWKTRFLSYSLPIDQFSGVPEDEVREAFRRMNANNVPLNAEEQRNARYQGPLKWFIISLADAYKEPLLALGVFSRRDIIRMTDLRMYAEIVLTVDSGFATVKGPSVDKLYKKYNVQFDDEEHFRDRVEYAVQQVLEHTDFQRDSFLRAHVLQSILLALIHLKFHGSFGDTALTSHAAMADEITRKHLDLETLDLALGDPESYPQLAAFIRASTEATNTENARTVRFLHFRAALTSE